MVVNYQVVQQKFTNNRYKQENEFSKYFINHEQLWKNPSPFFIEILKCRFVNEKKKTKKK